MRGALSGGWATAAATKGGDGGGGAAAPAPPLSKLESFSCRNQRRPGCAHSSFPSARGGIDWRAPVCQAGLAPNRGCGSCEEEKESGGGQEEEGAAAEARGYPPPPSSTTINTFAHQHTHPLLKGSLGVAVGAGLRFLPGKWDCLFPNKSEIFGTEGAATQHEQDENKSGGVAPKGATLPPVSGREGWTGEREKKLPTSGQQEVTSCSDSDKNQAALDERGC